MTDRPARIHYARSMRRDPATSEDRVWAHVRARQLGVYFRRQDPIGQYIADFSCRARRIIVELDGESHDDRAKDRIRDEWFEKSGWTVLRFHNQEVEEDLDAVIEHIYFTLHPHER